MPPSRLTASKRGFSSRCLIKLNVYLGMAVRSAATSTCAAGADGAGRPVMTKVVLQVIPLSAGAHQGMSGNFVIAEFADRQPALYQDTALRGQIIEDADGIEVIGMLWDIASRPR